MAKEEIKFRGTILTILNTTARCGKLRNSIDLTTDVRRRSYTGPNVKQFVVISQGINTTDLIPA